VGLIVGKNISVEEIMDDIDEEKQQPRKKKKPLKTTPPSNFGSSLLKILENRKQTPEDPEKYFLLSLLPQIKSLTEDQKSMVYIEFLNAIQRVKHNTSAIPHFYPYTQINQPSSYFSQQHFSSPGYYHTNDSHNVPTAIINSTITSPPIIHEESSNFSQPSSPAINSTNKQNYHYDHFSHISSPVTQNVSTPTHHARHYKNNYPPPSSPYNNFNNTP